MTPRGRGGRRTAAVWEGLLLAGPLAAQPPRAAPPDRWWGEDKLRHAAAAFTVATSAAALARLADARPRPAALAGAAAALAVGAAKELADRGGRGTPSWRDLVWDAVGAAAAAALHAQLR